MQFFYHKYAGNEEIKLDSNEYHYLFNVRRFKKKHNVELKVRNLIDNNLYFYIHKNNNIFSLRSKIVTKNNKDEFNLILALIEPKEIYDLLPFLNELDVTTLTIFYASFSQKNKVINLEKTKKILQYSSMQCGRSDIMKINIVNTLENVLEEFQDAFMIDFSIEGDFLESKVNLELKKNGAIIGCEGGFSESERNIMKNKVKLKCKNILRSNTALIYVSSILASI